MKISDIDKNFKVETKINEKNLKYISVKEEPFDLYGFCKTDDNSFLRLPKDIAEKTSEGVAGGAPNTAGGRVRFCTNSRYVAVFVKYPGITHFPHMPLTGTTGFDMYSFDGEKYIFEKMFVPPMDETEFEAIHYFPDGQTRDLTINFPLYNGVSELYIGLEKNASIEPGGAYKNKKPVVFYGSSITQGGCASRPGNSYQAILSREFDFDYVNLGFSGAAKAEKPISDYISKLDMSCFVYDYDHNALGWEYLKKTHEPMFLNIREKNPNLPIIMMSMPYCPGMSDLAQRKEVIKTTYENAVARGDKNVYFIDGERMYDIFGGSSGTVDGTHPNDLGFMCMAKSLEKIFEKIDLI